MEILMKKIPFYGIIFKELMLKHDPNFEKFELFVKFSRFDG